METKNPNGWDLDVLPYNAEQKNYELEDNTRPANLDQSIFDTATPETFSLWFESIVESELVSSLGLTKESYNSNVYRFEENCNGYVSWWKKESSSIEVNEKLYLHIALDSSSNANQIDPVVIIELVDESDSQYIHVNNLDNTITGLKATPQSKSVSIKVSYGHDDHKGTDVKKQIGETISLTVTSPFVN